MVGGFGSAVIEFNADNDYTPRVKRLGIPDEIIEHGTQEELQNQCGFDKEGIINTAKELVKISKHSLA